MGLRRSLRSLFGPRAPERVTFDDTGVTRHLPNGDTERVPWERLASVEIVTTSDGPWGEDVIWLLGADDGTGCAVPGGAQGVDALLGRLQRLPGFDDAAVVAAMGSTGDARFPCWSRA